MYTGLTASLKIVTGSTEKEVGYISNFSIEETRDIIEVSKLGEKTKDKIPSTFSWKASAEGAADFASAQGQADLRKAMIDGDSVSCKFYLDTTTYLTGSAYVESFSVETTSDDKTTVSISLSGVGELTMTPAVAG